ncbi:MAG: RNA methyltransferase [Rhodothermales bacterium]|nr:RNA methyltransferase [Rhodothermales bacterium]
MQTESGRPDPRRIMERLLDASGERFDGLRIDGRRVAPSEIIDALRPALSDERSERIETVLRGRTYAVATVVEGLANTGNVSAVMRTAEGLGFQSFHVVAGDAKPKHSRRTTQGAHKWLDVRHWDAPGACCDRLRSLGYRIIAARIADDAVPVSEVDFTIPSAVVFGNELNGLSDEMIDAADVSCMLPTPGFIQSFNISVAAAMTLYAAFRQRTQKLGSNGDLSEDEIMRLRADFYMRAATNARAFLRRAFAG